MHLEDIPPAIMISAYFGGSRELDEGDGVEVALINLGRLFAFLIVFGLLLPTAPTVFAQGGTTTTPGSAAPIDPASLIAARDMLEASKSEGLYRKVPYYEMLVATVARSFTLEEMRAIAAFYRSPLGVKFIKVMVDYGAALGSVLSTLGNHPMPKPGHPNAERQKAAIAMWDASGMKDLHILPIQVSQNDIREWSISYLASSLTVEEMVGITTFCKSSYGAKFIQIMPQIHHESLTARSDKRSTDP